MFKISHTLSIILSIAISVVFFIGCIVFAFLLPDWVGSMVRMHNAAAEQITSGGQAVLTGLGYAILFVMAFADMLLFTLLMRVRNELVFTAKSVSLIRGVSWCCILIAAVFAAAGVFFYISFIAAFAALFLGLCVRVVKNVIEQAVYIKSENDLTV